MQVRYEKNSLTADLVGVTAASFVVGWQLALSRESDRPFAEVGARYIGVALMCYVTALTLWYPSRHLVKSKTLRLLLVSAFGSAIYFFAVNWHELWYDFWVRVILNTMIDTMISFPVMMTVRHAFKAGRKFTYWLSH